MIIQSIKRVLKTNRPFEVIQDEYYLVEYIDSHSYRIADVFFFDEPEFFRAYWTDDGTTAVGAVFSHAIQVDEALSIWHINT